MNDGIEIGIDARTSFLKSVAFSVVGKQLAVSAIANEYATLIRRVIKAIFEKMELDDCAGNTKAA